MLHFHPLPANIQNGNCLREWAFQNFKCIFLNINFFNSTTSNAHNSAKNKARDLLLISFCREFHLVLPSGLNSKPTTWYPFIWTHTYTFSFFPPKPTFGLIKISLPATTSRPPYNFVSHDEKGPPNR